MHEQMGLLCLSPLISYSKNSSRFFTFFPFPPLRKCVSAGETHLLSWAEFVGLFIPLGGMGNAEDVLMKEIKTKVKLNDEELELLVVAFAIVDHGCDGRVSLTELRAACGALDGEEPPEAPVYSALGVSTRTLQGTTMSLMVSF